MAELAPLSPLFRAYSPEAKENSAPRSLGPAKRVPVEELIEEALSKQRVEYMYVPALTSSRALTASTFLPIRSAIENRDRHVEELTDEVERQQMRVAEMMEHKAQTTEQLEQLVQASAAKQCKIQQQRGQIWQLREKMEVKRRQARRETLAALAFGLGVGAALAGFARTDV